MHLTRCATEESANDPYRNLAAAILWQAVQHWRLWRRGPVPMTTNGKGAIPWNIAVKAGFLSPDAEMDEFLNGWWCRYLCEYLDLSHEDYMTLFNEEGV